MEKMIGVINNNLRSVINGIKEHKNSLEISLETIKNDMSLKIKEANSYKCDVENARLIISELENEISELENDLRELNDKFGAKDFKEILVAGNKEINAKIIEKRALINEQGQIIIELTDKAHMLKNELVRLRDKKVSIETTLEKSRVLDSYFETRINEIIVFSEEHPEELANYSKEIPQEELNVQENVDISAVIDGSIFEEIDEISSSGPDEELIKEVLENDTVEENVEVGVVYNEETDKNDEIDLSMTDQLENMISEAKTIIERNTNLMNEAKAEFVESIIEEAQVGEEKVEVTIEPTIINAIDVVENDNSTLELDLESVDYSDDSLEDDVIDIFVEEDNDKEINPDYVISGEKQESVDALQTASEPIEDVTENQVIIDSQLAEINEIVSAEYEVSVDENIISESIFNIGESRDVYEELKACGLDPDTFSVNDIAILQTSFDKNAAMEFINVLNKYEINIANVYKNVNTLVSITPQNLDKMLSLLMGTGAKKEDIDYIFDKLDKVNINKLEQNCLSSINLQLTEVLLTSLPYEESDIYTKLGLSSKEQEVLKKSLVDSDMKIFNMFPEIVMSNYEELKKLNINNLVECITKHPHKFIFNPSNFHSILDKYDPDDLVRCINKNSAVLDRL